ncbi:hypothetical protein PGTUg99_030292 [Puccinia graminis f. sp. tritici]|uniref:cysteine synthase n=3 Tax=Puccinia graminis f. sp. tritici TaxID=56615 RepID=A0A5B0QR55_PUCGR|nr:hypothetical protein PGTUg99_030292 [Puccinia graminis f. sp. tritici]
MNSITRSSTAYSKVFLGVILATGVGTIVIQWIYRPFKSTKRKPDHPRGTSTRPAGHSSDYPHVAHKVTDFIVIREAEKKGTIVPYASPRCRVFEGTSGSTGISLALVARALGYEAEIVLPDDTAVEKSQLIENMGATIVKVRPVSISNRSHYVNVARDRAKRFIEEGGKGLFVDQFENQMNWLTHYETTGPEIWQQSRGKVDYFVAGAGTGGTIAGVGRFLKSVASDVQLILADPPGSGLFNKVKHGVMFSKTEIEGKRRRHQIDTVVEGIGSNRLTGNLAQIIDLVDDAISVTDEEAIELSRLILKNEGLFIGSSSAVNLVACYKLAQQIKLGREEQQQSNGARTRIVTILCDSGQRHLSKFWNDQFLVQHGFLNKPSSSSESESVSPF